MEENFFDKKFSSKPPFKNFHKRVFCRAGGFLECRGGLFERSPPHPSKTFVEGNIKGGKNICLEEKKILQKAGRRRRRPLHIGTKENIAKSAGVNPRPT